MKTKKEDLDVGKISVDNIPRQIMKRLKGTAAKELTSVSTVARRCFDEALPPLQAVKRFLKNQK